MATGPSEGTSRDTSTPLPLLRPGSWCAEPLTRRRRARRRAISSQCSSLTLPAARRGARCGCLFVTLHAATPCAAARAPGGDVLCGARGGLGQLDPCARAWDGARRCARGRAISSQCSSLTLPAARRGARCGCLFVALHAATPCAAARAPGVDVLCGARGGLGQLHPRACAWDGARCCARCALTCCAAGVAPVLRSARVALLTLVRRSLQGRPKLGSP